MSAGSSSIIACVKVFAYWDVSSVKLFVTFISFHTTTRAVFNLYLSYLKRHDW